MCLCTYVYFLQLKKMKETDKGGGGEACHTRLGELKACILDYEAP